MWKYVDNSYNSIIMGGYLLGSSLFKLFKARPAQGLETLVRYTFSIAVAVALYCVGMIHLWQLACFSALAVVTGALHVYVFYNMKLTGSHRVYDGVRLNFPDCCGESLENSESDEQKTNLSDSPSLSIKSCISGSLELEVDSPSIINDES